MNKYEIKSQTHKNTKKKVSAKDIQYSHRDQSLQVKHTY